MGPQSSWLRLSLAAVEKTQWMLKEINKELQQCAENGHQKNKCSRTSSSAKQRAQMDGWRAEEGSFLWRILEVFRLTNRETHESIETFSRLSIELKPTP